MLNPNLPKISIITPSLNQGDFIERTICSVLAQDYPNLDYIIIDGGSTDNTLDIITRYSDRLRWLSEKDNGQSDAVNKGMRMAEGDIVTYINSDDLLEPGVLWRVSKWFTESPDRLWVTGKCRIIDENDREVRSLITFYKNLLLEFRSLELLLVTNFISQPATFWRRDVLQSVGFFDEKLYFNLDYDFFIRLWQLAPPYYAREYLASFRIQQGAKTTSSSLSKKYLEEDRTFIRNHASSWLILGLHDLHRYLVTVIYRFLQ